jgi:hypothetical protein
MGNRGTRGSLDADEVTDGDVAKRLSLVVGVSNASHVWSTPRWISPSSPHLSAFVKQAGVLLSLAD